MTKELKPWRRPGKGRPRSEDREQVLAHMEAHLAVGMTVSEIARRGLALMSHARNVVPGEKIPLLFKVLKGPTLERKFRTYREEVRDAVFSDQAFQRRAEEKGITVTNIETRYIGIRAPRPPLSFPDVEPLDRGRPKKMRIR